MRIGNIQQSPDAKIKDATGSFGDVNQVLSSSGIDSAGNVWSTLTVDKVLQATPDVDNVSGLYVRGYNSWVELPTSSIPDLPATLVTFQEGVPTGTPLNPETLVVDKLTGKFYEWVPAPPGEYYKFNGTTDYAVMKTPWTTLGNPDVYNVVDYDYSGEDNGIIGPPPVSDIGRVGSVYHSGYIYNLSLTDNSPMQGVLVNQSTGVGTIQSTINMVKGSVSLYYRHVTDANTTKQILTGPDGSFLSTVNNVLTLNATNCEIGSLKVDNIAYETTGPTLTDGQHCLITFRTKAGRLQQIYSRGGINNLVIEVDN
jgi:hypothetical protein